MIKKTGALGISILLIMALNIAEAEEGETIFKSQGCSSCHRQKSTSKVNPSLTEISTTYQGKQEQLIQYLKGESEAIVRPEKSKMMNRQIEKTKKLSDADLKALVDFLLRRQ